jgi:hypothetical protein
VSLDFVEIRRLADAAARDFLEHRWEAYLAMAERVEALPENQSGSDKSWVARADRAHREQIRSARLVS